jgi:hypothetical protein
MLYFRGVQQPSHIAERRQTEAQRTAYTARTGQYYSDLYEKAAGTASEGFTFGRGSVAQTVYSRPNPEQVALPPRQKVRYDIASRSLVGSSLGLQAEFDLLQRNDVHMTGEQRRQLESTYKDYVNFM